MGVPNPEYDIDLINANGESCKPGEQGEIVIYTDRRRPSDCSGNICMMKSLRKAYSNGVYHTGDVATRDEDGYFWFVGRADDVIKSSGYRIHLFEVESSLMSHPAVVECAITGVPDPIRGQIVKATIVLAEEWKDRIGMTLSRNFRIM